jgi:uncharacterized protein YbjT (DUF2867 family)
MLISQGESVTVVSRSPATITTWQKRGAQVAIADVHDTLELHRVFTTGKRLFLLNPPANPATDTDTEERKSLTSILRAIENSGLEKIVAESTYGAQPGSQIGDLGVLYEMEQHLAEQPIPSSLIRGAYYISNWDFSLQTANQDGVINTFFPVDFRLPMVAPRDIGQLAARLLTEPVERTGLYNIEAPERYSPRDVAEAFAKALQKPIEAIEIPPEQWINTMQQMGFSNEAAKSFSNMTTIALKGEFPSPDRVTRGVIPIESYIAELVCSAS